MKLLFIILLSLHGTFTGSTPGLVDKQHDWLAPENTTNQPIDALTLTMLGKVVFTAKFKSVV